MHQTNCQIQRHRDLANDINAEFTLYKLQIESDLSFCHKLDLIEAAYFPTTRHLHGLVTCFNITAHCSSPRICSVIRRTWDTEEPASAEERARIKNPPRRYGGEQHGHHVTRLSRRSACGHAVEDQSYYGRASSCRRGTDRCVWPADGERTPAAGPAPGERSLSRRQLGSRRGNAASSRAASENNFEETHLKSDLNIAHRRRGKCLEHFRLVVA